VLIRLNLAPFYTIPEIPCLTRYPGYIAIDAKENITMSINLKVIGAGMGRTGTTSLKLALELLLGGDCFHFLEYKTHPELMLPWQTFVEKLPLNTEPEAMPEISVSQFQLLMPDYIACVDEPASFYWLPLSKAFPEALIILSVRDTESWWKYHACVVSTSRSGEGATRVDQSRSIEVS
jgi:hypothetical protein